MYVQLSVSIKSFIELLPSAVRNENRVRSFWPYFCIALVIHMAESVSSGESLSITSSVSDLFTKLLAIAADSILF